MLDKPDGGYVSHEDYAALEHKLAESQREFRAADATIENLQMQVEKLAAENAEMKEEISNITFMRDDDFFGSTQRAQEVMGRLVNVKTPETDAFLAEVRAQGADECVRQLVISDDDDFSDAPNICAMVAHQLRKGVQS
ncbi:TPA: hypothetical protein ACG0NW_002015 [Enterobacter roggenkampii]|uniref:hypothetical protein n=1 Tax=Enterobacter roggenkampii TaxID=1812935 RepID=UPI0027F7BB1A|nr:hypothetical protein [Enterobacter roggenkampii]HCM9390512.1 hypothetical protein [Enterobacter roggenkampii]HDT3697673.1 hypothetical protein [Enterobacter roggenkampii]